MAVLRFRTALIGGDADALDSIDGNLLAENDCAIVFDIANNKVYYYKLVLDSNLTENVPDVIVPDVNPGDKRWVLMIVWDSDKLDGYDASSIPEAGKLLTLDSNAKFPNSVLYIGSGNGLNADKVDGFDASQTPAAGQIPVLNSDGSLYLPFSQTPIYVNGQDLMNRTFYVDAVNGDDNNPGTEEAPFKTIEKAIVSVPVGGHGAIFLMSDVYLNTNMEAIWKNITIRLNGYSFNLTVDSRSLLRKFSAVGLFALEFRGSGKIVLPVRADDPTYINNHPYLLSSGANGNVFKSLALTYGVEVVINDTAYKLLEVNTNSTSAFSVHGTLTDNTGSNLTWADLISGIVRDANGVPRNVISNIVL